MRKVFGILLIIAGAMLGAYVGVKVLFINGIVDVIDGAKADPTNAEQVAWGIVQIFPLAEFVGYLIFGIFAFVGYIVMGTNKRFGLPGSRRKAKSMKARNKRRPDW